MKKIFFLTFIMISTLNYSQKRNFQIYQFEKKDSLNGHISKIVKFNENGLKIYEELNDFKTSSVDGVEDYVEHYFYRDTLIIKSETTYRNSDEKRLKINYYNKNNLLETQEFKSFERRIRKDVKKGFGIGDCIITEDDYEKTPSWETVSKIHYSYNFKNQRIEYYAPDIHWSSQNRYKYEYDNEGRKSKIISLENNIVLYEESISYKDGLEEHNLVWMKNKDFEPHHYFISTIKNSTNNRVEIRQNNADGTLEYIIIKSYDSNNQIISEKRFDSDGNLEITYVYQYQ